MKRKSVKIVPISTLQYAGRKRWFLEQAFKYFGSHSCETLIEICAGSGIVGLSLLFADVVSRLTFVEKDSRVVCVLRAMLSDPSLADRYKSFEPTKDNVSHLLKTEESAFRWLVQSRVCNRGKFDGGLRTVIDERWCRDLVVRNLRRVYAMRDKITVIEGDSLEGDLLQMMRGYAADPSVGCFADPPYGADPMSKGRLIYLHHKLNHQKLFSLLSGWRGPCLLTEDNSRTVRRLALCYRFSVKRVKMNTSDNKIKHELMIWRKRRPF